MSIIHPCVAFLNLNYKGFRKPSKTPQKVQTNVFFPTLKQEYWDSEDYAPVNATDSP